LNIGTVFFVDVRAKVLQVMTERVCHCSSVQIPPPPFFLRRAVLYFPSPLQVLKII
jgi:hypothetical protein